MLHILHLIRRRHPESADTIILTLALLSASGLVLGLGVLLL